jgi:PAS domain S-box-containing protein
MKNIFDFKRLKKMEEEMRASSRYARNLIEASLDPLVTISADGKITDVNNATIKVTGVSREQLIGSDFSDYFTEPAKAKAGYKQAFSEGIVMDYPLTIRNANGITIDVLYNASVYKNEAGEVQGVFAAARDITDRKKMEEEMRASSRYARNLIEASLDPLVTISAEGKITDVNNATIKVTGVSREQLIGSDFSDYFTEPAKAKAGYKMAFSKGIVMDYPLTLRNAAGDNIDVLYNASVYKNDAGEVQGVFAAARDITDRKKMEEEMRSSSLYARNLIEASLDPLVTISAEGKITDVNNSTIRVTGVTREKLIGSDFADFFTEPEKARAGYKQVFSKGIVRDYPLTLRNAAGVTVDVLYNASVYKNESGEVQGVFAAARDITDRKKMEEEMRLSSLYARNLIEASLDPLVTISAEGKITDVNNSTIKVTGVTREQLIGSDFADFFTEPDKARAGYKQVFSKGIVRDYPLTLRNAAGATVDVLYNASVYKNEEGEVQGVFAAARDITDRKKMEEEMRLSSLYARNLIEASLDPLVTISAEGKITDVNSTTIKVTGVTREQLIGSDFADYFTEPDKARAGYKQVFSMGIVMDYPLTLRNSSGQTIDVLYNATVYKNEAGEVQGVFAAARDITERKKQEKELITYREQLEDMVKSRTADLSNVLMEVKDTVNILVSSSTQILAATTQVASGTAETATAITETSTTVEEVQQAAKQTAQKAKNVAESAQLVAKVSLNGQKAVEDTVTGMNLIREQMDTIAQTVVRLSEQSQSIGGIIASVTDIADQSNLLAVNAAIEAAKAGEQGKGFAVVAQEIKNLAGQSKQSTLQVRNILNDVQKATSAAVMATEQGSKAVEAGVKQSLQAGEAIRILSESSNEAVQAATQIVASSQQQVVGMDQIGVAMQNINQAGTETAVSMEQSEKSAKNLNDLGQKLQELVEKFKV